MAVAKLTKQDIFQYLLPEQINLLSESGETKRFPAGKMVYTQGSPADHFFIIKKGHVTLRLPSRRGISVIIDELDEGSMFGGCVTSTLEAYSLNAQCSADSEILVLSVPALKAVMNDDPRLGYYIQSGISEIYFRRYIETMDKLQSIVMNIPVATD